MAELPEYTAPGPVINKAARSLSKVVVGGKVTLSIQPVSRPLVMLESFS